MTFTVVSTFSGCGGSSLGYQMAGGKILLAVEWDAHAVETYRANFPTTPIYHGDINDLSVDDVLSRTGLNPGELDIFDGSPPCQGFSTAGKRNFNDTRNQLFRQYTRLLEGLQPKVFVMENVSGMAQGYMRHTFAEAFRALEACGYAVKCQLMNAMYFGVPQSRRRVIFIGVRKDLSLTPSHPKAHQHPAGCVRLDSREAKYSDRRYGDALAKPGKPVGTITKIGRMFWSRTEEFGPRSYMAAASFPPNFIIPGSLGHVKARIGNTVPPLFMKAIAEHIRDEILAKLPDAEDAAMRSAGSTP